MTAMNLKVFASDFCEVWPYHQDYAYDIESYPNFFSCSARHMVTNQLYYFEISDWRNDLEQFTNWLWWLHLNKCRGIGFNNAGYDYTVTHYIFCQAKSWAFMTGHQISRAIYAFSSSLFKQSNEDEETYRKRKWKQIIKESEMIFEQIDLFKIYHYDRPEKATSLKVLQINMRSDNVEELPIPPGTVITEQQRYVLAPYNVHDVDETVKFAKFSLTEIKLREKLTIMFGRNMMNHNEAKMGEDILRFRLEEKGIRCRGGTPRPSMPVASLIFPYIKFERKEFNDMLEFLRSQVIVGTKEANWPCVMVNNFPWQFGKGGMHGSIDSAIVLEDDIYEIIDVDVISFYPRTAVENMLFPKHLGSAFVREYDGLFDMRAKYPKKTHPAENHAFKIALNSGFGKSNSEYSFLYDPAVAMSITINGQLMLCMLGEQLIKINGLSMIQANTDGLTFRVPRAYRQYVEQVCEWWMGVTRLKLEWAFYKAMYIRDVNNYIAVGTDGKVKQKGAYVCEKIDWHKDHSAVIIARAAVDYFTKGVPVIKTITECKDPFDFMIKAKVPKSSTLWAMFPDGSKQQLQNVTRYYVALNGAKLCKQMPPTEGMIENWHTGTHYIRDRDEDYKVIKPGGKRPARTYRQLERHEIAPTPYDRMIGIQSAYQVMDCANATNFNWSNLNCHYYIAEAMKLITPLEK